MRVRHGIVGVLFAVACAERLGQRNGLRIRQDEASSTIEEPAASSPDNAESSPAPTSSGASRTNNNEDARATSTDLGDVTSAITITPTDARPLPTGNVTLPDFSRDPHELPISPEITPALGIAGAILIVAGLVLGFVGIKHRPTQTFLSTSLLIALGIEVLIVYLMHPPVSDAIQGAFLIAGVVGGCALGGLALIFKEMSEGFGCLLGGFCLAMWLLVLAPGGLVANQVGRIILIGLFSAAGFCLYISRWTRIYGIIFCTSFAGAYAFILGIDCFSKAGLKEFWLFIWDLNDDVFPLYTDTYPINRDMRAEIAAIIVVAFFGIMSQIKIWKIVKEQKAKRDAERLREQEERDAEEAELGRDIESQVARDRSRWEVDYDGKEKTAGVRVDSVSDLAKGSSIDEYDLSTPKLGNKRFSLSMHGRGATTQSRDNLLRPTSSKRNSSVSLNFLNSNNRRASAVPSLPPLDFNFDDTHQPAQPTTPSTVLTSGTPGLGISQSGSRAGSSTSLSKCKASVKRLSMASLTAHDVLEEAEHPDVPEEVEDDLASSIAATMADAPDMDALSYTLSRPASMYLSHSPGHTPLQAQEEIVEDADDEALCLPSKSPVSGNRTPRTPRSVKSSYFPDGAVAENTEQVELKERLPKRISKAAANYRTNEWAKEVSRAEPVPLEEEEEHTSDAVQIETANAAKAARAEENNAAPTPTPPPSPPPAPKSKRKKSKRQSQHRSSSGAAPTPVYAHKNNQSEDEWDVPLAKRVSSNPALNTMIAPANNQSQLAPSPIEQEMAVPRRVSEARSPIPQMHQTIHRSASKDRLSGNRLSQMPLRSSSSMSNLLDQRQDRLESRLTTTSFMSPSPAMGMATVQETSSSEGTATGDSSQGQQSSNTSVSGGDRRPSLADGDDEDMTLAERKALVQRQSNLAQQNAALAHNSINPRRRSSAANTLDQLTYTSAMIPPPINTTPIRLSSVGPNQPMYDSHQPRQISSHNANKQAMHWNQWRNSNLVSTTQREPIFQTDSQMDMLRAARMQSEAEARARQQQRAAIQEQMDQHMRMGGMHDAHRAALARMQGQANRNVQ